MKRAVCVIIPSPILDSEFLAVSRRNSLTVWGFPGGKVDPGESEIQAIVREALEETGLFLDPAKLVPIYCDVCPGKDYADSYWVTTYVWTGGAISLGDCDPEEGLAIQWSSARSLTSAVSSPFANYNVPAFEAYEMFKALSRAAVEPLFVKPSLECFPEL